MKGLPIAERTQREQDRQISEAVERERPRLRNFIRRRVADDNDVEDILQEVFYELVETLLVSDQCIQWPHPCQALYPLNESSVRQDI